MAKLLDINALADEAIVTSPDVDPVKAERAKAAFMADDAAHDSGPQSVAMPPVCADDISARHGRVAAKSVAIGYKNITSQPLDGDVAGTLGDVFGELFGILSRMGRGWAYWGVLAATLMPIGLVIGLQAFRTIKDSGGHKDA